MWMAWAVLMACGDSATFEEVAVEDDPVEELVEEPVEIERAPELEAPIDARPDEFEANTPQTGQAWPPIVVPQDQREREWEWDFKVKGNTKVEKEREAANEREMTLKELEAIENASPQDVEWK